MGSKIDDFNHFNREKQWKTDRNSLGDPGAFNDLGFLSTCADPASLMQLLMT